MKQPIILGINRTQDASITLFEGKKHCFSIQKERLTRQRHHWGKLGDIPLYLSHFESLRQPIDCIVEGYSCDKEIANISQYHQELRENLILHEHTKIIQISHHLSHAYSAYYPSGYEQAAVMILDSVGSQAKNFTEEFNHGIGNNNAFFEVASFYHMEGDTVHCLHKQLWDGNKKEPRGLGQFYFLLTQCIFPGEGKEGKVMGLSQWGDANALKLPPLEVYQGDVYIPPEWQTIFNNSEKYCFYRDGVGYFHDCANLAAAGQKAFEDALLELTRWLASQANTTNLCYAGGTALNCSANGKLLKYAPFKNIFIPPAPHDGGTSLGCALYGLMNHYAKPSFDWKSDYLGPNKPIIFPKMLSPDRDVILEKPDDIYETVTNGLLEGEIMALFLENSEFGPRALGHRSIIADPRFRVTTDWINQHIKKREWFRPIAPFVLEEDLETVFDVNRLLPHMLYAVPMKSQFKQKLSAGVHIDGTARVQSVSADINPFLTKLLKCYKEKIGVGVLLNTSFNRQGEPIIETFEEALDCFLNTPLHALLVPPYIIRKKNLPPNPLRT